MPYRSHSYLNTFTMGYHVYIRDELPHNREPDGRAPRRPHDAPAVPPNNVLGVFGLSVRTRERDLEDEFGKFGDVERVVIVYDQRVSRTRPRWTLLTPD